MTERETLLPCPFCGGEANLYRAHQNKMLALGEKATDDHYLFTLSHHDCAGGFSIVWTFKPKAALIAAWNTRHTPTAEAMALLKAALWVLDGGHSYESEGMARDYARALLAKIEGQQP